jgi:hypothetical protein
MQSAVFVDVVEDVEFVERPTGEKVLVVPSTVRLQELDSPALSFAERSYLAPFGSVLTAAASCFGVEDRKGRLLFDAVGDMAAKPAQMELEDDVVERGSEIGQGVTDEQRSPCSIEFWPRVSIEATHLAFNHVLGPKGIRTEYVEPGVVRDDSCYFRLEALSVFPRSAQLLPRPLKAAGHGVTLS